MQVEYDFLILDYNTDSDRTSQFTGDCYYYRAKEVNSKNPVVIK